MKLKDQVLREKAYEAIKSYGDTVNGDIYRQSYHLMPPVGLLNDPNGFIQWKGKYHIFFQWMPFKTEHGAKFWGHYTSKDFIHWTLEPIALTPSDWYDKNGCYSGSAVEHDGKMKLFYTGNVKDQAGNRETYQCVAESEDGVNFQKEGVLITLPEGYTAHFRDPKVWGQGDKWYMVIGAQSYERKGCVVLFESSNLKEWTYRGKIAQSGSEALGELGYMWECPDLFTLNKQDVLLFSPQGLEPQGMLYNNMYQTGYVIGNFDSKEARYEHGSFFELDRGFEFYAPQTTLDDKGRRLLIGWMGVPDQDEDKQPTRKYHWIHNMTIPRELHIKDNKLYQTPIEELKQLRRKEFKKDHLVIEHDRISLDKGFKDIGEVTIDRIKMNDAHILEIEIHHHVRLIYNREIQVLTLERRSFVDQLTESRSCKLMSLKKLQLFIDNSSLEVFVNDGEEVFTSRVFPYKNANAFTLASRGKTVCRIRTWTLDGSKQ